MTLPEAASFTVRDPGYVDGKYDRNRMVTYLQGTTEYATELSNRIYQVKNLIKAVEEDTVRVNGLIATWEPKPLMTVEEAKGLDAATKAAEKAAKEQAKELARVNAPTLLRTRLMAALKAQDTAAVAKLWIDSTYDLASTAKMTPRQLREVSGTKTAFQIMGFSGARKDYRYDSDRERNLRNHPTDLDRALCLDILRTMEE